MAVRGEGQKKYNDGMSVEFPTCKRAEEVVF